MAQFFSDFPCEPFPDFAHDSPHRTVNRSPRIRTCLRAEALQRAGVNFPCTTAAFTLPPESAGFVVLCQLAQELSLVCPAHWRDSSARTFALRLPSDGRSPFHPCLRKEIYFSTSWRLVLGLSFRKQTFQTMILKVSWLKRCRCPQLRWTIITFNGIILPPIRIRERFLRAWEKLGSGSIFKMSEGKFKSFYKFLSLTLNC